MTTDPDAATTAMRVVRAGGARINAHGSTDDADAIRLACDHWREERAIATAALEAVERGEVTVDDH